MDRTETYIKMSWKAKKIQELWKEGGQYDDGASFTIATTEKLGYPFFDVVWLPRQDQLQKMIKAGLWQINFRFSQWLFDTDDEGLCDFHIKHSNLEFTSMEQLWLAFVMKEKYNKIWDGEDWVKTII